MARVEQTNADVYLQDRATIFAYNPASRMLLWARHNKTEKCWELYRNGKQIDTGRPPYVKPNSSLTTHYEMLNWVRDTQKHVAHSTDSSDYVRGRIAPDKKTIYIHDLESRYCVDDVRLGFDRHVKWALKKVGMYMKSEKKGVITDVITKRKMERLAERYDW